MDSSLVAQGPPAPSIRKLPIRICRLCLCRTPVVFSLLDPKIGDILGAVAAIEVSPSDPVSTECCLKCLLNLKLAYRIRRGIRDNERRLKDVSAASIEKEACLKEEYISSAVDVVLGTEGLDDDAYDVNVVANDSPVGSDGEEYEEFSEDEAFRALCAICLRSFDDLVSYNSHFSICPLVGADVGDTTPVKNDVSKEKELLKKRKVVRTLRRRLVKRKRKGRTTVTEVVETKEGTYQCLICEKEFPTRDLCRNHWYSSHKTGTCPICNNIYSYTNLPAHIETHSSTATRVCDLCGKTLKNKNSLRRHILLSHKCIRYSCDHCDKVYQTRPALRRHFNREHSENPIMYICDSCGKKFNDPNLLRDHVLRMHERKREFICKYCNKSLSCLDSLRTHTRQHTNETPYRCKVCGEGFRQNVSLRLHMKSKHGIEEKRDVPCKVCGKAFASMHAVKAHMRLHF